jgi:hypothetical protein
VGDFQFGPVGSIPLVGDWTGSGHLGIGVFDPSTATFFLRSSIGPVAPDFVFQFGPLGGLPVAGDWLGTGQTGVGVFDPNSAQWFLRSEPGAGAPDAGQFAFGPLGALPVAGNYAPLAQPVPAAARGGDLMADPLAASAATTQPLDLVFARAAR